MLEKLFRLASDFLIKIAVFEKRNKINCDLPDYKGGIVGKYPF